MVNACLEQRVIPLPIISICGASSSDLAIFMHSSFPSCFSLLTLHLGTLFFCLLAPAKQINK
uniref:Ovule protein n=1 Tax=Romanomermis culicivorax TaxID=13658 RepID=A0A915JFJ7_ROMCU